MSPQGETLALPSNVAFGAGVELTLVRSGDVLTVYPKRTTIKVEIGRMLTHLAAPPKPSFVERRDVSELPERPDL